MTGKPHGRQASRHGYYQWSLIEIHGPFPTEVLKLPEALALDMNIKVTTTREEKALGHIPYLSLKH